MNWNCHKNHVGRIKGRGSILNKISPYQVILYCNTRFPFLTKCLQFLIPLVLYKNMNLDFFFHYPFPLFEKIFFKANFYQVLNSKMKLINYKSMKLSDRSIYGLHGKGHRGRFSLYGLITYCGASSKWIKSRFFLDIPLLIFYTPTHK